MIDDPLDFIGGFIATVLVILGLYTLFTAILPVPPNPGGGVFAYPVTSYLFIGGLLWCITLVLPALGGGAITAIWTATVVSAVFNPGEPAVTMRLLAVAVTAATPYGLLALYDALVTQPNRDSPDRQPRRQRRQGGNQQPVRGLAYRLVQRLQHAVLARLPNPDERDGFRQRLRNDRRVEPAEREDMFDGALDGLEDVPDDPRQR